MCPKMGDDDFFICRVLLQKTSKLQYKKTELKHDKKNWNPLENFKEILE